MLDKYTNRSYNIQRILKSLISTSAKAVKCRVIKTVDNSSRSWRMEDAQRVHGCVCVGGCSHPPHLSLYTIAMIACKHMFGYRYHRRLAAEVVVVVAVAGASVAQSEGRKGRARV